MAKVKKFINYIRRIPSWVRAAIIFILYTFFTKPIEIISDNLSTMNNLISHNVTYFAESIQTNSKDFWEFWLYCIAIIVFVLLASWLFGSDDNLPENIVEKLKKEGYITKKEDDGSNLEEKVTRNGISHIPTQKRDGNIYKIGAIGVGAIMVAILLHKIIKR